MPVWREMTEQTQWREKQPSQVACCKELETLPAGTKPGTTHHRSPGGQRRGKRKRSRACLKGREKAIINQTNIGTASKATLGKLQRRGWAHMDFSEHIDTILNWTELKTSNSEHSSFALLINLCSRSLFYRVWVRFDQRCSNCAVQIMLFTLFLILLLFLLF